ncbi:MAG: hypothetical protein GX332_03615 [Alcaligenaceae bacterium]|nr:hypothetical protein [Paenalcaligenes sp.]NLJ62385.1 hypothetical protein [Alcaligenaceae bacterium]
MFYQQTQDLPLSDDLERRLIQQALEQQNRLRPLQSLKRLLQRLFA